KNFDATNQVADLFLATSTGARCALASTLSVPVAASFLASGGGAVWSSLDGNNILQGMFTNTATCATNGFAPNTNLDWVPMGAPGFVYGDDSPALTTVSIRYSRVACGMLPPGTSLHAVVDPIFGSLFPAVPAVVYTVDDTTNPQQGIYINAPLPFTAP